MFAYERKHRMSPRVNNDSISLAVSECFGSLFHLGFNFNYLLLYCFGLRILYKIQILTA